MFPVTGLNFTLFFLLKSALSAMYCLEKLMNKAAWYLFQNAKIILQLWTANFLINTIRNLKGKGEILDVLTHTLPLKTPPQSLTAAFLSTLTHQLWGQSRRDRPHTWEHLTINLTLTFPPTSVWHTNTTLADVCRVGPIIHRVPQ